MRAFDLQQRQWKSTRCPSSDVGELGKQRMQLRGRILASRRLLTSEELQVRWWRMEVEDAIAGGCLLYL
jgi:hypothetical protein